MYNLEPYQEQLVYNVATKLASGMKSVLAQLATGGGKTVVFSAICHRYVANTIKAAQLDPTKRPQKVIILVHRTELLQQTRRTLWKGFGIQAQPIKAGMRFIPDAPVYVAMVESVNKRMAMLKDIGLVIIDECHLANFNKMHKHFPTQHIIGFTATPLAASRKNPLKNYYQDIVCGVDIPDLISLNRRNPERGLVQNITRVPKVTVNRKDLNGHVDTTTGDFSIDFMAAEFGKAKNIQNTVHAYRQYAEGTKTLIFNVNIEHSLKVMQAFRDAGYDCKHIDGEMPGSVRDKILHWFATTPNAILCNVAVLTAGYDEPGIETVIINRSTTSLPLWLQMCGRGARPLPWKSMFTIIDMGDNARPTGGGLGDWCDPRNWNEIFWNPPPPGGEGNAPVKDCPSCQALVPMSTRVCPFCGYIWPAKLQPVEQQIEDFVIFTKGIDVNEVIETHKTKKQYFPFFKIGEDLAKYAYSSITEMNDQAAEHVLKEYHQKAEQWCMAAGKPWNEWHQKRARNHLYEKLAELYKDWKPSKN